MIIDTHCHLDLFENMEELFWTIANSRSGAITMTTTPRAWKRNLKLCRQTKNIYPALGIHPQVVHIEKKSIPMFIEYLPDAKFVGEIGLDNTQEYREYMGVQREAFRTILEQCTLLGGKVLSIHSRGAEAEVLEDLENKLDRVSNKSVFHWYTGNKRNLAKAIELGSMFSINEMMLNTKNGVDIIREIPLDRVLIETDSPFSCSINNGAELEQLVAHILIEISKIKNVHKTEVVSQIERNQRMIL